jgi:membrane protease YdiL (CAAX protease family)
VTEALPVDERVRWGMGDALAATCAAFVASLLIGGVALTIADVKSSDDLALWAVGLLELPLWLGLLGVPVWASRRKGLGSLARDFGLRMKPRDVPIGLAVGFAAQIGFALVFPPLYRLVGLDTDKIGDTAEQLGDRATDPFGVICLFLIVVVGAPVIEEICYRGLWMRSIERRWGAVTGVVLSAVVFGAVHFQPYDMPILIAVGLVLAALAASTGRLGPAIWAHVAFNLTAFVTIVQN